MRTVAYFKKTFVENLREWKILILTLLLAPAFIYMMFAYYRAASPAYRLLVINHDWVDSASGIETEGARGLLDAWRKAERADGKPVFAVTVVRDTAAARGAVADREADLLVEILAGFSKNLSEFNGRSGAVPAGLVNHADEGNLRSAMAMAFSDYIAFTYAVERAAVAMPLNASVQPVGRGGRNDDFSLMVPALLMLAVIMILFTAAASLIKEIDRGTMIRLTMSNLRRGEFLAAISANQVMLGLGALMLAYLAAVSCGYRSEGSFSALLIVGGATAVSVVAVAVITAAFLKSMFELLTVGVFPFFILMFFSECMFPLPKITMLSVGGRVLYVNDLLPTALGVRAFAKILHNGAGLAEVAFELSVIAVLTIGYFAVGAWLFRRRHERS